MTAVLLPRVIVRLGLAVVLVGSVASCRTSPIAPTDTPPFSQTDLFVGMGNLASSPLVVSVHYIGWLYNPAKPDNKGAVFDTSRDALPFTFQLGADQTIDGFDRGVSGMKEGGLRRLVIPPSLAYGELRTGGIPPYTSLVFEVELMVVQQTQPPPEP